MEIYVVEYNGPFGFIKPPYAVRDGFTNSQSFLIESTIIGIEIRLFNLPHNGKINYIKRNKLIYDSISKQQEQTMLELKQIYNKTKAEEANAILDRGLLINPKLYLGFDDLNFAEIAREQCISLCRNEDLLIPNRNIVRMTHSEFDLLNGNEFIKTDDSGILLGNNRFNNMEPIYGEIKYVL